MILTKIPQVLLSQQIGGLNTPQEMRKTVFLKLAPDFLRSLVGDLGLGGVEGVYESVQGTKKESGKVTYTSSGIKLEVYEDPGPRDGVDIHYTLYNAMGVSTKLAKVSMRKLATKDNYGYFIHELKTALASAKPVSH